MDDFELQEMRRKALESLMRKKRGGGDSNPAPRRASHLMDSGIGDEGENKTRQGSAKCGEAESDSSSNSDDEVYNLYFYYIAKLLFYFKRPSQKQ